MAHLAGRFDFKFGDFYLVDLIGDWDLGLLEAEDGVVNFFCNVVKILFQRRIRFSGSKEF